MIRHRYEAWNAALIPSSAQARAKRAAQAKARAAAAARARAAAPVGPPRPPNAAAYPFPEFEDRSEAQWQELLDARVKPYETAVKKVNTQQLGQSEFAYEQAAAANKALSVGFANLFTGGKAGDEGKQFAKENFGGELMGMQAVAIAHDHLTKLTSDWNERDWEISTEYQKAMAEIPGLKEQMRESIYRQDTDEYTRNFNYVNLMLDEAWNIYEANAKQYNTDQQLKAAEAAIRREQGIVGFDNRKDAELAAQKRAGNSAFQWGVRRAKDGSWEPFQTKVKKPVKAGSKPSETAAKNAALAEAKWQTENGTTVHMPKKVNGVWTTVDTGKKKPAKTSTKNAGLSNAQKAESDLAHEIFTSRDKYVGKKVENPAWKNARNKKGIPQFITEGGMDYNDAYAELFNYAFEILSPYGRDPSYVARWVRSKLDSYYPGTVASAAKPRGG